MLSFTHFLGGRGGGGGGGGLCTRIVGYKSGRILTYQSCRVYNMVWEKRYVYLDIRILIATLKIT